MRRLLVLMLALIGPAAAAMEPPHYVGEKDGAGIEQRYAGGWEYYVGGGVAAFDCNGDGLPDLFIAGGSDKAGLFRNRSTVGGALRFSRVADSGLELDAVTGAYPLDIDGDGKIDLVVLRVGENVVFRGLGDCRFARANEAWGFQGGHEWSTAFSARWEKGNAWPTLAIGNYVDRGKPGAPFGTCHDNQLIRPDPAGGRFGPPIALKPGWCALSMLFSDWNRSGNPDLRISDDRQYYRGGEEQLWHVRPGEPPRLYGRDEGWKKMQIWGMGIASYDLDGDGYPEYFLTSMGDNKLQGLAQGPAEPLYQDIALGRGATAQRPFAGGEVLPSTGWHAAFRDVNNDGYIDLFVTKGNVEAMQDFAMRDPNNLLLGEPDGKFAEAAVAAGLLDYSRHRGAALVDLNLDGMLDLVVVNRQENVKVWRNVGWGDVARPAPMGNWIELRLQQPGGNRDAVGAWIEVRIGTRTLRREVSVGGGHAGGELGWIHFGLGTAERAQVRVQWPDGEWGPWIRLFANEFARVDRGATQAVLWLPPTVARATP